MESINLAKIWAWAVNSLSDTSRYAVTKLSEINENIPIEKLPTYWACCKTFNSEGSPITGGVDCRNFFAIAGGFLDFVLRKKGLLWSPHAWKVAGEVVALSHWGNFDQVL